MKDSVVFNLTPIIYVPGDLTITSMAQLNRRYVFTGAAPTLTMNIPSPSLAVTDWLEVMSVGGNLRLQVDEHTQSPQLITMFYQNPGGHAYSLSPGAVARFTYANEDTLLDGAGISATQPM